MSSVGPVLKVDPVVLRNLGAQFDQAGDALAGLHADAPLSDAASGVPQLTTAQACTQAQTDIATQMTSLAEGARAYAAKLNVAAMRYESGDHSSVLAIGAAAFLK